MSSEHTKRIEPGSGFDAAGYFRPKLGRQALVLIHHLFGNQNGCTREDLFARFCHRDGFASDSTVRFELERLKRKMIVIEMDLSGTEGFMLSPNFRQLLDTFDLDVDEMLEAYSDATVRCSPIFQGRHFRRRAPCAFVLMPFVAELTDIYRDHIQPTVQSFRGLTCRRADEIFTTGPIVETIWKEIVTSSVVIADLTGRNPNVFYETGIAHTLGAPTLLLCQSIDDVPFDLRHMNVILYDATYRGCLTLRERLQAGLETVFPQASAGAAPPG